MGCFGLDCCTDGTVPGRRTTPGRARSFRARAVIALLAVAQLWTARAAAADPDDEELSAEDIAADQALSYDVWYIRADVGLAYVRAETSYHPQSDDSNKKSLIADGMGLSLRLGVGVRPATDVTLGILGAITHVPITRLDGQFSGEGEGLYYAMAYVDHRLPAKILRIGGGAGIGQIYTFGPDEENFSGIGPVGGLWLAIDAPSSRRVALGIALEVTGAALRDTHSVFGQDHDFNTFMLVAGLHFTMRISEPSLPKSMPSFAGAHNTAL